MTVRGRTQGYPSSKPSAPGPDNHGPTSLLQEEGAVRIYLWYNTVAESATDPQVLANEYVVPTQHPTMGPTRTTGLPVKFSRTPAMVGNPAPEFGQHTEEVLTEVCGYNWAEVERLREAGVI